VLLIALFFCKITESALRVLKKNKKIRGLQALKQKVME